jgi:hypothetical protein
MSKMSNVDLSKAKDFIVVRNYVNDPFYCPYCLRCAGIHRMKLKEPFLWEHSCGAIHDERQVIHG